MERAVSGWSSPLSAPFPLRDTWSGNGARFAPAPSFAATPAYRSASPEFRLAPFSTPLTRRCIQERLLWAIDCGYWSFSVGVAHSNCT